MPAAEGHFGNVALCYIVRSFPPRRKGRDDRIGLLNLCVFAPSRENSFLSIKHAAQKKFRNYFAAGSTQRLPSRRKPSNKVFSPVQRDRAHVLHRSRGARSRS